MLKHGTQVQTLGPVYAARQKQQKSDFELLPAGTVGVVKHIQQVPGWNIQYYFVKFDVKGKKYFARLGSSILEEIG